ncbi:MAG TPA: hypothetical protein VF857_06560, partial [Spirochaetota bacterium]
NEYSTLDLDSTKEYGNNIYNHLISANPDLKPRIRVIRSKTLPMRDLLFIDGKLYEILEYRENVDALEFKELFVTMKNIYGIPEMNKESDFTAYTYKNDNTQVILISKGNGDRFQVRIYLYSRSLFHRILID